MKVFIVVKKERIEQIAKKLRHPKNLLGMFFNEDCDQLEIEIKVNNLNYIPRNANIRKLLGKIEKGIVERVIVRL